MKPFSSARTEESVLPDGRVRLRIEALGADMANLIDARLHLRELSESGARVEVRSLGQTVLEIRGEFLPRAVGTHVISAMTIGSSGWLRSLNLWLIGRFFPATRRRAWLKHSVEEIGNFEFFLPELYRSQARI